MKRLIGMPLLLALAACGPDFTLPGAMGPVDKQDILKSITSECEGTYQTSLKEVKNASLSPKIILKATNHQVQDKKLPEDPSKQERCLEIANGLSQAPVDLKLEINFKDTLEQAEQMRNGNPTSIRPDSARLEFTDGSFNNAYADLTLRCPDAATVACRPSADNDSPCESYDIIYVGKCTFTSGMLFYTFSDLKKTTLDLKGEIDFFGSNGAEIRFTNISWRQIY